jgi:ketopantoate reductase
MGKRRSHGKKRKNRPKNVDPPKFTLCDLDNNKYENYDKQREVVNELVAEICRVVKQSTPKSEWSLRGYEKFVIPRKDKWINESMAKEWAQMIEEICKGRKEDIAVSNGQVLTKGFEYVDEHSLPSTKTHMVAHVVHLLTEHIRGPSILDCPQSKVKVR